MGDVKKYFCITAWVAACLLLPTAQAAEPTWRGKPLAMVRSKDELPDFIRFYLQTEIKGQFRVADIGQPIRMTDVIYPDFEPDRRLLAAGSTGDTWIVAIEHATGFGRAFSVAYLFEAGKLAGEVQPNLPGGPGDFASLVSLLEHPALPAKMGDIPMGISRAEAEARLGIPTAVTAPDGRSTGIRLDYPDLILSFDYQAHLESIASTSARHCLAGNICPGVSKAAIEATAGAKLEDWGYGNSHLALQSRCGATFAFVQDKTYSIALFCGASGGFQLAPAYDSVATAKLMSEWRGATAAQVLLIPADAEYDVTLVDREAAKSRVHADACRYIATDSAAMAALAEILDSSLLGAATASHERGTGGEDYRLAILFEKNGKRLNGLYVAPGVPLLQSAFNDGDLYLKKDVRERVENWLTQSGVQAAGTVKNGQPCNAVPAPAKPLPVTPVSQQYKEAVTAAARNHGTTFDRLHQECGSETGKVQFCQCLASRLSSAFVWADDGWALYKATIAQKRYPSKTNPWYKAQEYSEAELQDHFINAETARKSCMRDTNPLPPQPVATRPTPPPPVIGK